MSAGAGVVIDVGNGWHASQDGQVGLWLGPERDGMRDVLRVSAWRRGGEQIMRLEVEFTGDHVSELLDCADPLDMWIDLPAAALPMLAALAAYIADGAAS